MHVVIAVACLVLLGLVDMHTAIHSPYWVNHLMHFLGGAFSGYLVGSVTDMLLSYKSSVYPRVKVTLVALAISAGAISGGSLWEEFEYRYIPHALLQRWAPVSLYEDTMNDMRFDRLGGVSAMSVYLAAMALKKKRQTL